jgi:thiamine-monophosphate kinase
VPGTLGELGEFGLIASLRPRFALTDAVVLGPGDDAAVVRAPDGRVVASTDILVDGRHFRRDWSSARDVGRRAAAANLADIAAMGARPTALLVGLAAPAETEVDWLGEFADGMAQECAAVGATVVGGDVVASDVLVISVTALGDLEGRFPVRRDGARVGDVVAVAGSLGRAAGGLAVLRRGFRQPRALVDAHRVPSPPYALGVAAAVAGASAMIDVSDGLLADLGHLAEDSGVSIELSAAALAPDEDLASIAGAMGADPMAWVLTGGDDHALAACFAADGPMPEGFRVIGVVAPAGPSGPEVYVDGLVPDLPPGHEHFRATPPS